MKFVLNMLVVLCAAIWSSCSANHDLVSGEDTGQEATVSFTLDGSNCLVATRSGEVQSDSEKKITSLYAVIFKSASESFIPGTTQETNEDLFYAVEEVHSASGQVPQDDEINLTFRLGAEGNCVMAFVANPNETLLGNLKSLTGKKVSDFKAIVTDENPDNVNKLMISEKFHSVSVKFNENAVIDENVRLRRAMARIDVKNACPGITVNKIVFNKRMSKSAVIVDVPQFDAQLIGDATYDNLSLVGSQKNPSSKTLYSYEQYGNGDNIPSLDIYYTANKQSYKATIKLDKEGGMPVLLKRNTLYVVNLKNESGNVSFNIEVADWNTGENFEVSNDDLINGMIDEADNNSLDVKKGVFMLKDGSLKKASQLTADDYSNVLGIVVTFDKNKIGEEAIKALGGMDKAHGLVMALKNIQGKYKWKTDIHSYFPLERQDIICKKYNGYKQTKEALGYYGKENFPVCGAVEKFRTECPKPISNTTTDWFVPSDAQWIEAINTLGGLDCSALFESQLTSWTNKKMSAREALNTINEILKVLPGQYIDTLNLEQKFWTSSYCENNTHFRTIRFTNGELNVTRDSSSYEETVRCFLAF